MKYLTYSNWTEQWIRWCTTSLTWLLVALCHTSLSRVPSTNKQSPIHQQATINPPSRFSQTVHSICFTNKFAADIQQLHLVILLPSGQSSPNHQEGNISESTVYYWQPINVALHLTSPKGSDSSVPHDQQLVN